jgi:hypothetical protein
MEAPLTTSYPEDENAHCEYTEQYGFTADLDENSGN